MRPLAGHLAISEAVRFSSNVLSTFRAPHTAVIQQDKAMADPEKAIVVDGSDHEDVSR